MPITYTPPKSLKKQVSASCFQGTHKPLVVQGPGMDQETLIFPRGPFPLSSKHTQKFSRLSFDFGSCWY